MKLSFFAKLSALLVLGLVVVFIIDPLDPSTISTPFMLGIILMGLALRQGTSLVVVTSLLYSALTVYALLRGHQYFETHVYVSPHPYFWLFQRMGLFLVLCALSIYLAYYRTDTQRIIANVQNILAKLPAPVVISDAGGRIMYVNEALSSAFKKGAAELTGHRYVDVLMTDIQEGKAVRYYIELFESEVDSVHEIELKPFEGEDKIRARLTCLGSGPARVMITLFDRAAPVMAESKF